MFQSSLAVAQTPATPAVDNLTISIRDDYGNVVGGGCFGVTDASGQYSSFCDDDADGFIELGNVPAGDAVVVQESAPAGYTGATSQTVYVLPDQTVVANFYVVAIPVETPEPTVEVTEVPTEAPTEVVTEVPTEVATEAPTESATEESSPTGDEEAVQSRDLIQPMAFEQPGAQCTPYDGGRMDIVAYIYGDETDEAPVITYTQVDRFGNESDPQTATMTWDATQIRWEFPLDVIADEVIFSISAGGETYGVFADCSVFNPIQPLIETMAVDGSGGNLPDGTQIDAGTPFGDTARFVNLGETEMEALAGQTVTYHLYEDDAQCGGTPVASYSVVINADGTIPPTPLYTPTGNGVYDWQVTFEEFLPNFSTYTTDCGAETVVVGEVVTTDNERRRRQYHCPGANDSDRHKRLRYNRSERCQS